MGAVEVQGAGLWLQDDSCYRRFTDTQTGSTPTGALYASTLTQINKMRIKTERERDRKADGQIDRQTQTERDKVPEFSTRAEGAFPLGLVTMLFFVLFDCGWAGNTRQC